MKKINYLLLLLICLILSTMTSCGECKHETEEIIAEVPATCVLPGKTGGIKCADCGEYIVTPQVIPTIEHEYTGGSCSVASTCSVCGVTGATTGVHSWGEWSVEKHATTTQDGLKKRVCTGCSAEETEVIPMVVHVFGEWYQVEASTCAKEGHERRDCTTCGYYETRSLAKTNDHTWGSWSTKEPGSCTVGEVQERTCSVCNGTEEQKLTAVGHEIVSHLAQAATCTVAGHDTYDTCANCGYTTFVETPATGHSFGSWYEFTPATSTTNGEERRDCNNDNCTHYESRDILATGVDTQTLLQADLDALVLPNELSASYNFTTTGANGTVFTYSSSNTDVLDDDGTVVQMLYDCNVTLTVVGTLNNTSKEKEVTVKVLQYELPEKQHQIIIEGDDLAVSPDSTNFSVTDGVVELKPGITNARFYLSEAEAITTPYAFTSLVASWGATNTSADAYVRVRIALKVNGSWSNWVSYGEWGFEKSNGNASGTESKGLVKISTDEVMCVSGTATAIQYEVTLTRTSTSVASPKFKYISLTPQYVSSYSYEVNRDHLPESVCHDVPKRYQLDVTSTTNGVSGNVMCSATSTTMMLEHYGKSSEIVARATQLGYTYPQEYIARNVVRDVNMSGGGFGNWTYNTVAMSHYGFKSYVARFYSIEELMYQLTKGPVCLSISKCTMTQYEGYKQYSHSGHIIVAIGYQYINGNLYITCNDPYVSQVKCNYSESLITTYWKYIGYVIES